MSGEKLQSYTETLSSSVNIFPIQKEKLESALNAKDYPMVLQWMKSIKNRLGQIHADNLVRDCEKHMQPFQDPNNIRHERLAAFIEYFFSSLTIFFSDIHHLLEELEEHDLRHEADVDRTREKVSKLTELDKKAVDSMSEEQLEAFISELNDFIDNFEAQKNGLRDSFKLKQYDSTFRWMSIIEDSLNRIHAYSLTEDLRSQMNQYRDVTGVRHERMEAFVNYFLNSLTMLADDVKALNLPKPKKSLQQKRK